MSLVSGGRGGSDEAAAAAAPPPPLTTTLHHQEKTTSPSMSNDPSRAEKVDDSATAILRPKKRCVAPLSSWPRHPLALQPHSH